MSKSARRAAVAAAAITTLIAGVSACSSSSNQQASSSSSSSSPTAAAPATGSSPSGSTAVSPAASAAAPSAAKAAGGKPLTVWTVEDDAHRVATQQQIFKQYTQATGVQVNLVALPEDSLATVLASSAAAKQLPDVVGAASLGAVNQMNNDGLLDTSAAADVVQQLGSATFSQRALQLTRSGDTQLAVPSDGWAQLLFYRKDLFDKAGLAPPTTYEAIDAAAKALNTKVLAGIVAATSPADSFTQQTFEHFALANGCQLVDASGALTLNSPACQASLDFYANLIKSYSVPGNQDADTTRATYFAGKAAMVVWSSFLLDELAGLRNDALPTCPECKGDPTYLSKNTGIVSAIKGPNGSEPASFGEIVSWGILKGASPSAKNFVNWMMSQGYESWLGIAPEGKVPTRTGTATNATEYTKAWENLKAGVDTKSLLSAVYSPQVLQAVAAAPNNFSRWGIPQGQGSLAGAVADQFVIPQVLAKMINSGLSGKDAADEAQKQAEGVKSDLPGH